MRRQCAFVSRRPVAEAAAAAAAAAVVFRLGRAGVAVEDVSSQRL